MFSSTSFLPFVAIDFSSKIEVTKCYGVLALRGQASADFDKFSVYDFFGIVISRSFIASC